MNSVGQLLRHVMRSTAMGGLAFLMVPPLNALAFDPNDDTPATQASQTKTSHLPSTAPLIGGMPRINFSETALPTLNPPAIDTQTAAEADTQTTTESTAAVKAINAPVSTVTLAPAFPPVDADVAAQAAQKLAQPTVALPPAVINTSPGFIAPAPLITPPPRANAAMVAAPVNSSPASTAPVELAAPMRALDIPRAATVQPAAPLPVIATTSPLVPEKLSDATKNIVSHIPSKINTPPVKKSGKMKVERMTPEIKDMAGKSDKIESYEGLGISIKVRRPGLDTSYELNHAYNALMGGDTTQAIEIYKNILSTAPSNQDALFGLASIYHRAGDIEHARPYYGELLKVNPNHREGLNNFLVMMSDESPQEALAELDRLEQRNPDFSPIPAQQAVLLNKLGYAEQAHERMLRAIELAPENLTYKYNLAVMLDGHGDYVDAAALYRMLIDASLHGAPIPSSVDVLQKRLNFIATATTSAQQVPAVGG